MFPHMTVAENLAFGLEMRKMPRLASGAEITEALRLVRLDHLSDRLPRQLSGPAATRGAGPCAVFRPMWLLDEPLSISTKLRQDDALKSANSSASSPDYGDGDPRQEEALTMADRLVVMSEGRVRQIGSQQDLYERPSEKFVADFVGRSTSSRPHGCPGRSSQPAASSSPAREVARRRFARTASERLALMSAAACNGQQLPAPWSSFYSDLRWICTSACRQRNASSCRSDPAGTAAAGDRRTGHISAEQSDRPRISVQISPTTPGGVHP